MVPNGGGRSAILRLAGLFSPWSPISPAAGVQSRSAPAALGAGPVGRLVSRRAEQRRGSRRCLVLDAGWSGSNGGSTGVFGRAVSGGALDSDKGTAGVRRR